MIVHRSGKNHLHSIDSKSGTNAHPIKLRNCAQRIADDGTYVFSIWLLKKSRRDRLSFPGMFGSLGIGDDEFAICVVQRAELAPIQIWDRSAG